MSFDVLVFYNGSSVSWNNLESACATVRELGYNMARRENEPLHLPVMTMTLARRSIRGKDHSLGFTRLDLLLHRMRGTQATDPRDKVFAWLGIASDFEKSYLVPHYWLPLEATYVRTAQALSRMKDLSPLEFLSFVDHPDRHLAPDLPSWCPDWRKPR